MSKNTDAYIAVVSRSWNEVTISFSLPAMSRVSVDVVSPENGPRVEMMEESAVGRVCLEGLPPGTPYLFRVTWSGGARDFSVATLPAPEGPLQCAFAAMADPHVSFKPENRKGRLFVESVGILRELTTEFNLARLDFVLIAGDLTNSGTPEEYQAVSDTIEELDCPCLAVPGDHDVEGDGAALWEENFGPTAWRRQFGNLDVIGLDTSDGCLTEAGRDMLSAGTEEGRVRVLVSHHQLIPDDYIRFGKNKIIRNRAEHEALLSRCFETPTLIYAGHQNVPSRAVFGQAIQLNLPQPVQFPCGYVLVRQYENGFYHTFRPTRSELLNEGSRVVSNMAAEHYDEPQWRDNYRAGRSVEESCFLHAF